MRQDGTGFQAYVRKTEMGNQQPLAQRSTTKPHLTTRCLSGLYKDAPRLQWRFLFVFLFHIGDFWGGERPEAILSETGDLRDPFVLDGMGGMPKHVKLNKVMCSS